MRDGGKSTAGLQTRPPRTERHMDQHLDHDHNGDGVDRRGFLKCMAWAGTGMVWAVNRGCLSSVSLGSLRKLGPPTLKGTLFFSQISDSHIGFSKEANPDVTATLQVAVGRLNALPERPAFVLHTGDIKIGRASCRERV